MAVESGAILAGVGGTSLCWVAPVGSTLPTDATTAFDAAWLDLGWVSTDGLTVAVDEDAEDIQAYGSLQPVRTLITSSKVTFQVGFMESNPTVLALYHRKPLSGTDEIPAPDTTGAFSFKTGSASTNRYAFAFDMVDGANHIRAVAAECEVTEREEFAVTSGEAIQYGVTLTAYPQSDGEAIEWHYVVDALKTVV